MLVLLALFTFTSCDEEQPNNGENANNNSENNSKEQSLDAPVISIEYEEVKWNAVEGATGYVVSLNGTELDSQTETQYTITETAAGTHTVKVKAIGDNAESSYSNEVSMVNKDFSSLAETTLFLVGDSTVSSFDDTTYFYPRYGYGTKVGSYLHNKVTVKNLALSGRSSKNFVNEDNYKTLSGSLKAGDYLLIGFGHNDEKSDDASRFTDATLPTNDSNSFKYSLYQNYVKLALDKGATPILCTPVCRANSKNDYEGASAHVTETGDYAKAIRELGEEFDVTVIDLTELTKQKYSSLGYEEAIYYHAMTAGVSNDTPNLGSVDTTHLNEYGAKHVGYLVASELEKAGHNLGKYVLDRIREPLKANDLKKNASYVYVDYVAPNLASYTAPEMFETTSEGWYGTAFGDCGGTPTSSSNGYVAQETSTGIFKVVQNTTTGTTTYKGKFADAGDGFAFLFKQVDISKNFEITASAKVLMTADQKQAGFGLMLRDDCYLQTTKKEIITTNYVTAGLLTAENKDTTKQTHILFDRVGAKINKSANILSDYYAVDDTAILKIKRTGQSIITEVTYKGETYTESYLDFDLVAKDNNYMYVGMFATRGTIVEFTNVEFTITGTSQGA